MPVIVGAPRSGTTLLRFMLDAHPGLAIPPETGFLPSVAELPEPVQPDGLHSLITSYHPDLPGWNDFGISADVYRHQLYGLRPFSASEGVREFYRLYAADHGKSRYGDKTPTYCQHMPALQNLLPEAHFIHIIRDGRDVALSLRNMWFGPGRDMTTLGAYWSGLVQTARTVAASLRRYLEVRYEALIHDPEGELRTICAFLHLDFDGRMLRYWEQTPQRLKEHGPRRSPDGSRVITHERRLQQQRLTMHPPQQGRVSAWRFVMTPEEQSEFQHAAGPALRDLGYL